MSKNRYKAPSTHIELTEWLDHGELPSIEDEKLKGIQAPAWAVMPNYDGMTQGALADLCKSYWRKNKDNQNAIIYARKAIRAYAEFVEYVGGPYRLRSDRKVKGRQTFCKQRLHVELDAWQDQRLAALGLLRRFIPSERYEELFEAIRSLDIERLGLAQAAAVYIEQIRNGSERIITPATKTCTTCHLPLGGMRRDARYCSDRCRMLARNRKHQRIVRVRNG